MLYLKLVYLYVHPLRNEIIYRYSVLLVLFLYINISTRYCINRNPRIGRLCQIRIEVFYCSGVVFVKTYITGRRNRDDWKSPFSGQGQTEVIP